VNKLLSPIAHIIFDLDGTLTDPGLGITRCALHTTKLLGLPEPSPEQLRACIGPPLRESFVGLLGSDDPALIERAVEIYRVRTGSHGIYENEVYPGVVEMLTTLRERGFGLVVATSRPGIFAHEILKHFQLGHFFSAAYCAQLDGSLSTKGELIALLLAREGLPANACIMIGDRMHDVIGAKLNGLQSVGVTYGYGSIEELTEAGADYLCGSAAEITALFTDE
jgi:phosphoglycolate phosphatase